MTTSYTLTTINPNSDYNTSLPYFNGSSISTEGSYLNTTSVDIEISTTSTFTNVDNQTNTNNSGDGSQGSTVRTTGVTTLAVSGGLNSTEADVTDNGPNGGVSHGGDSSGQGSNTTSGADESGDGMSKLFLKFRVSNEYCFRTSNVFLALVLIPCLSVVQ